MGDPGTLRSGCAAGDSAPQAMPAEDSITAVGEDGTFFPIGKLDAHRRNVRHLAISAFVFSRDGLLLQRRAASKYHSGGLWANTCCSHPRWRETPDACAARRLREEVGMAPHLAFFGVVEYGAPVGDLFENEVVHCYAGALDPGDAPRPDPREVDALRWMPLDEIGPAITRQSETFAPWFRIYVREHFALLRRMEGLTQAR